MNRNMHAIDTSVNIPISTPIPAASYQDTNLQRLVSYIVQD